MLADEALPRTPQEIERSIQENEIRLEEVQKYGEQQEKKLTIDPTNRWNLDYWLALVKEKDALQNFIEASRRRLRKLELQVRYKELNARHNQNKEEMIDHKLLQEMSLIAEEKQRLDQEGEIKFKRYFNSKEILEQKKYDYRNFQPIFSFES